MKPTSRGLLLIVTTVLLAALLGGVYGQRVQATAASSGSDLQDSLKQFTKVYSIIEQNYADPVNADRALYQGAIPGMLRTLDPHSNFFDTRSFSLLREEQRGRYYGVGMTVAPRDGKTIVLAPFVGSPAYRAGIRPGDVIIQVDDRATDNLTTTEVADMLKGPKGTVVRIKIMREGHPEPLSFTITRDEIPRLSVEYYFELQPHIGYIRISNFNETTDRELSTALERLDARDLKGLILDLRGNPGGLLTEGVGVADMFLQKNQLIVSHRGRSSSEKRYYATHGNGGLEYPLVVLMNRFSASAAEIVAGAIQDHDRGLIVGETSFGKGLVQTVYPLSENTGLALTTARYYTPSGRLIQRDFHTISLYNYYYGKTDEPPNHNDIRMTDSGREVFGGGGITPDVRLAEPQTNRFQDLLLRRDVFFNFAKYYLAQHETISRTFEVDDAVMNDFRHFLDVQHVRFTEPDITESNDWVRRRIKRDLFISVFGLNDGYRVEIEGDYQVQKALELLPKAKDLADNARRILAQKMAAQRASER